MYMHTYIRTYTSYNFDHINFRCTDKQTKLYAVISWPMYVSVYTGTPSINSVTSKVCFSDITISWSVTSDPVCGPVSFILTISPDGMMMMRNIITSYDFTGLIPGTNYTVSIEPSSSAGSGQAYTETIRTAPNSEW